VFLFTAGVQQDVQQGVQDHSLHSLSPEPGARVGEAVEDAPDPGPSHKVISTKKRKQSEQESEDDDFVPSDEGSDEDDEKEDPVLVDPIMAALAKVRLITLIP
jgi:hypothetical protein